MPAWTLNYYIYAVLQASSFVYKRFLPFYIFTDIFLIRSQSTTNTVIQDLFANSRKWLGAEFLIMSGSWLAGWLVN